MEGMQVIRVIRFAIYIFGIVLHATGMAAIITSTNRSNQTIIMLNLSIADMSVLMWGIVTKISKYSTFDPSMYESQENMFAVLVTTLEPRYLS